MNHDKLLAKIDWTEQGLMTKHRIGLALRVVVEQHKPIITNQGYLEIDEEPCFTCECDPWNEYDRGYPCPTIQAIEKELA